MKKNQDSSIRNNAPDAYREIAVVIVFSAVSFLLTTLCYGQAQLIKDLNRLEDPITIEYGNMTQANNAVFFTSLGKELWNSNGTFTGTTRFKALDSLNQLTWSGTTLYFAGQNDRGWELWKSNGPGAATNRIKDIYPGGAGSNPDELTNVNGVLFFIANDGKHGTELWKSDGTAAGTVLVKDIFPGHESGNPAQLANVNGVLYFSADNGKQGHELWKSDGTGAGTIMLKDINPGNEGSSPESFIYLDGRVYFTAFNNITGRELWKSNGSGPGTVLIKNIRGGSASSGIDNLVSMGNAFYFTANDGKDGYALWKSTGTNAGTTKVINVYPGNNDDFIFLKAVNNNLYFLAPRPGEDENYLWRSDGSIAGTRQVMKMENTYPAFTPLNGSIYFFEYYFDQEIYGGFIRLNKMNPDGTNVSKVWDMIYYNSVDPENNPFRSELMLVNNSLLFYGIFEEGQGYKLLRSDGSKAGTEIVKDVYAPTLSANPSTFVNVNGVVYFHSMGITNYEYVYRTDGTAAGTFVLKRFDFVREIQAVNDNVFFSGVTPSEYAQLWKTNGNASSTVLLKQFDLGYEHTPTLSNVHLKGTLFFHNANGELWKSNGSPDGTVLVKKFNSILSISQSQDQIFLFVMGSTGAEELWKSDGTTAGTVRVKTIAWNRSDFANQIYLNNILYFVGRDRTHGAELWRSDGTSSGTYMVTDLRTNDLDDNDPYSVNDLFLLVAFQNTLYFNAKDDADQYALYRSDGTHAGTRKLANMVVNGYIPYGEQLLLFPATDEPPVLWTTDGTPEGTRPVKTLGDASSSYDGNYYKIVNNVVYFSIGTVCCDGPNKDQLWRTDGTECGTYTITTGLTVVSPIESIGNTLILGGYSDFRYGKELYRFDLSHAAEGPCDNATISTSSTAESLLAVQEEGINTPYPNPFSGNFCFRINGNDNELAEVNVLTITGVPVERLVGLKVNTDYFLGSSWAAGLYLLKIKTARKTTARKVLKQ